MMSIQPYLYCLREGRGRYVRAFASYLAWKLAFSLASVSFAIMDRGYNLCEVIISKFIFNILFSAVIKHVRLILLSGY